VEQKEKQPFPIQIMEVKCVEKRYPHFRNRESGWIKGLPTPGDNTEYQRGGGWQDG